MNARLDHRDGSQSLPLRSSSGSVVDAIGSSLLAPPRQPGPMESAALWVQITLCLVVAGLLLVVIALTHPPSFAVTSLESQGTRALRLALGDLRLAIQTYRIDHACWPGYAPAEEGAAPCERPNEEWLVRQLEQASGADGATSSVHDARHPYGPYLEAGIPSNPFNRLSTVRVLHDGEAWPDVPDDLAGWIYRPSTGELRADCSGEVPLGSVRLCDL